MKKSSQNYSQKSAVACSVDYDDSDSASKMQINGVGGDTISTREEGGGIRTGHHSTYSSASRERRVWVQRVLFSSDVDNCERILSPPMLTGNKQHARMREPRGEREEKHDINKKRGHRSLYVPKGKPRGSKGARAGCL